MPELNSDTVEPSDGAVALGGGVAEISFTLTITRAATGLTEEIPMVGRVIDNVTPADAGQTKE